MVGNNEHGDGIEILSGFWDWEGCYKDKVAHSRALIVCQLLVNFHLQCVGVMWSLFYSGIYIWMAYEKACCQEQRDIRYVEIELQLHINPDPKTWNENLHDLLIPAYEMIPNPIQWPTQASTCKYTGKMLCYTKTIFFGVKRLK